MSGISEEEWQKMSPEARLEMQVKNCIFCKLIKGEIPSNKVYDDANFVGILDANPGNKGHVLLLSKKHVQIMPQLGAELCGELGVAAKRVSAKLKGALGIKGTSIFVSNGAVAGQQAPHFMLHIIPRTEGDNINLDPESKSVDEKSVEVLRNKFISSLGLPVPGDVQSSDVVAGNVENDVDAKGEADAKGDDTDESVGDTEDSADKKSDLSSGKDKSVDDAKASKVERVNKTIDTMKHDETEESLEREEKVVDKDLLDKIRDMFD